MAEFMETMDRYKREREKRMRIDGVMQYTDVTRDERYKHFAVDPAVKPANVNDVQEMFPDGRCKVLIVGAGWSGLLYAVRMVQAGVSPADIRIIDTAGGWGGTWYWNRYPGLMCDVESYIYLPLLEETGYMPKHRYAYGEDIREYAAQVAKHWKLSDSAVFQTSAKSLDWDDQTKEWNAELVQQRNATEGASSPQKLRVRAQFAVAAGGILHWPQLPDVPGILDFKGDSFHTSRWNYELTGGSSAEPSMTKLKDKRVAYVGTGVTACQAVPHLAEWAKHLYVVQRTPASVDIRGQRPTDEDWFHREVATGANWQRERKRNFNNQFTTGSKPESDLVADGWTDAVAMCSVIGNQQGPTSMEALPGYLQQLHMTDMERQNRIRARVKQTVKDPDVAEKLQPQYPTWCKRPGFHDEYLEAFNKPNVTLIDTDGKGLDKVTSDSIVFGTEAYPVDLIVYGTGYKSPVGASPAERINAPIRGCNGASLSETWQREGPSTLHGLLDKDFPNLFLAGFTQGSTSPNFLFQVDEVAKHAAYILTEAQKKAGDQAFAIAPNDEAVQSWAGEMMARAFLMAGMVGCTPSYANAEGSIERIPPEQQMKMAKAGIWGHGVEDYVSQLEQWRQKGGLPGLEIQT